MVAQARARGRHGTHGIRGARGHGQTCPRDDVERAPTHPSLESRLPRADHERCRARSEERDQPNRGQRRVHRYRRSWHARPLRARGRAHGSPALETRPASVRLGGRLGRHDERHDVLALLEARAVCAAACCVGTARRARGTRCRVRARAPRRRTPCGCARGAGPRSPAPRPACGSSTPGAGSRPRARRAPCPPTAPRRNLRRVARRPRQRVARARDDRRRLEHALRGICAGNGTTGRRSVAGGGCAGGEATANGGVEEDVGPRREPANRRERGRRPASSLSISGNVTSFGDEVRRPRRIAAASPAGAERRCDTRSPSGSAFATVDWLAPPAEREGPRRRRRRPPRATSVNVTPRGMRRSSSSS